MQLSNATLALLAVGCCSRDGGPFTELGRGPHELPHPTKLSGSFIRIFCGLASSLIIRRVNHDTVLQESQQQPTDQTLGRSRVRALVDCETYQPGTKLTIHRGKILQSGHGEFLTRSEKPLSTTHAVPDAHTPREALGPVDSPPGSNLLLAFHRFHARHFSRSHETVLGWGRLDYLAFGSYGLQKHRQLMASCSLGSQ